MQKHTDPSGLTGSAEFTVEAIGDFVTEIVLCRPERLNALGVDLTEALLGAVKGLSRSRIRVVMFRGTGRAFCAGADLKERRLMNDSQRLHHNSAISALMDAVAETAAVTICVINGLALGGGCELALACDLRIASAEATIGLTESRVGAIPGAGGTQRLPRIVGAARALELMLIGDPISSARAFEIGLVNETVPPAKLDARARTIANQLAGRSPAALRDIKRLVGVGLDDGLEEGLRQEHEAIKRILCSDDYAEGLLAFSEKRPPVFSQY